MLVLPDSASSATPRAYFIPHLILSYQIIVSLCSVEPLGWGG